MFQLYDQTLKFSWLKNKLEKNLKIIKEKQTENAFKKKFWIVE